MEVAVSAELIEERLGKPDNLIGILGTPGTTNTLDSRQQPIISLTYGNTTSNTVTGFPYTTYQVQVPAQQIAWQIAIPSTNGNPNAAVRRNSVPNENYNEALSELDTTVTDNIVLVPPLLHSAPVSTEQRTSHGMERGQPCPRYLFERHRQHPDKMSASTVLRIRFCLCVFAPVRTP